MNEKGQVTDEVPLKILDVAGGTGDISFKIHTKAKKESMYGPIPVDITVSDINPQMLAVGEQRAKEQGIYADLKFLEANAETIPSISDDSYDLYTIAFGIWNVSDRDKALREAYWVLRRGGRFMCLEFSEVTIPVFKEMYDLYSFNVIPLIG